MKTSRLLPLLTCLLGSSVLVCAQAAANKTSFTVAYEKFTLENGLQVVFHLDRSDPVVAVSLTAHVGSARERPGMTGFAHLFEHLLFLESENLGKGGLDKLTARIGGSGANGSTSRDRTNYLQTVPKDALEPIDVEVGRSGGVIVPNVGGFPHEARAASMVGQTLPLGDGQIIARQILADKLSHIDLVAFDTLDRPDWLFVPNETILALKVGELEVVTAELETCRAMLSAKVPEERIKQAYAARTANVGPGDRIGGKWAAKRFSWAVERFCSISVTDRRNGATDVRRNGATNR
jgi:hypothetical protein